ncbi:MAG: response regulator [Rhodospirillales bacterium]
MAEFPFVGLRILIVEDETIIALDLKETFNVLGAEVVGPAMSGDEALDLIALGNLDAAVVDVNLGGKLGGGVAAALRAVRVPTVVLTGRLAADLPEEFRGLPVVPKPFGDADLIRAVVAALGKGN